MSISPAQLATALTTSDPQGRALAERASPPADSPPKLAVPSPVQPSGPTLSTSVRIDEQRHIYYEVINNRTGDVVIEIPPEQIRRLGEGLTESRVSGNPEPNIDVRA